MSVQVTIHEAKTHLSRLIAAVEAGEEVVIARRAKPVARLVPEAQHPASKRSLGFGVGRGTISEKAIEGLTNKPDLDRRIERMFEDSAEED